MAQNQQPSQLRIRDQLTSDFKYTVNSVSADLVDFATAPSQIGKIPELLKKPKFYLVLAGTAAAFGGSFALDQTMRAHLRGMSASDANIIEGISTTSVAAAAGLLYLNGLRTHDPRARHYMITAGEGVGMTDLLAVVSENAFGRLGPNHTGRHDAFFHGGVSFPEGEVAPLFSLAAGVASYYHDRWYADALVYSLASLEGIDRMGEDKHWFSDVVMGALLGVASTKLLLYMHERHEQQGWRFKLMAAAPPSFTSSHSLPIGATIALRW